MESSLENMKKELANKYLGIAGIHGIGIDNTNQKLKIYYDPMLVDQHTEVFKKIEKEAHPFGIEIIASNRAMLH